MNGEREREVDLNLRAFSSSLPRHTHSHLHFLSFHFPFRPLSAACVCSIVYGSVCVCARVLCDFTLCIEYVSTFNSFAELLHTDNDVRSFRSFRSFHSFIVSVARSHRKCVCHFQLFGENMTHMTQSIVSRPFYPFFSLIDCCTFEFAFAAVSALSQWGRG